ncbi:hypothetical protein [Pseudomonas sp. FYR_7]|uniref:hypothetical protein n=1 Tax=Pseudomonas sp. FYR_7 TaxID=3367174 RepID=UPI00370BBAD4
MNIPSAYIQTAQADPLNGTLAIISYVEDQIGPTFDEDDHALLIEALALVSTLREADLIFLDVYEPKVGGPLPKVCSDIWDFLRFAKDQLLSQSATQKLENLKKKFSVSLNDSFGYKFTDGDVSKIQHLINELRDFLVQNTSLDESHRQRMMKRLEDLQKELHKKVSDLSKMYALWGDAGIMLGKFGEDAKPFVDRCREIMGIAFRAEAQAENLPSDSKPLAIGSDPTPPRLE